MANSNLDKPIAVPAAAKLIGISARSVYKLIESKSLAHYRPGTGAGRIVTTERFCRQYMERVKVEAVGENAEPAKKNTRRVSGDVKARLARHGIKL